MPLLTIKDLLEGDPVEVASLLGQASGLTELYNRFEEQDGGSSHYRHPGIHASEVSGCQRRMVYTMRNEPKSSGSTPLIWKRRFKVGHAVHDMLQREFQRMMQKSQFCITFEPEVPISPQRQLTAAEWDIWSSCDGVFTLRETWDGPAYARVALEIKTASPDDFEKMTEPKKDHIEQAHIYMKCLDVPVVWFLYFNKGNQNITSTTNPNFFVQFDPKIWADLESRFEAAHTHVHLNTLPERQEGIGCEFCGYSQSCQPKYLERKKKGFAKTPSHWGTP